MLQYGVILIQNKNCENATTIASMFNEPFMTLYLEIKKLSKPVKYSQKSQEALQNRANFIFNKMKNPILFLIFDIGVKTIWSPLVKVSYSYKKNPQIWTVHSRDHINKTFGCLKTMDSSGNSTAFFASVIEKMGQYANIAKENIGYGKLLRDAKYKQFVDSSQDNSEEKIYDTSTANFALMDPQELEDIGSQEDTQMSNNWYN